MHAASIDRAMRAQAERQHSVISRRQARALGATKEILCRCTSLEWEPVGHGVLRLVGSVVTDRQRAMVGVLSAGAGALVSHLTAAFLWDLPGFGPRPIHVVRPHGAGYRGPPGVIVHHARLLPAHHRRHLDGVPVTSVARTVFDLAGCLHPARTERVLDNALNRHLVPLEEVRSLSCELLRRGRAGTVVMRRLLAERGIGYVPVASGLEARFLSLLVEAGIELPERQVDLGGEGWVGRVDFYYRRLRLVVEVDGEAFHTSKLDREHDARRDAALRAAGFEVLRVKEHVLRERPWEVVAVVRAALEPYHPEPPKASRNW